MNALRTGLTGRTVLLASDDADLYTTHIEQYRDEFKPVGPFETELVQSLADTSWRLRRIPGLELAMYGKGRHEFANSFDEHDPTLRAGMIELHTFLKYEKVFRNLQLQESRLTRRYANEMKELRTLQSKREEAETSRLAQKSGKSGTDQASADPANGSGTQVSLPMSLCSFPAKHSGLPASTPTGPAPRLVPHCDLIPTTTQFEFSTAHAPLACGSEGVLVGAASNDRHRKNAA